MTDKQLLPTVNLLALVHLLPLPTYSPWYNPQTSPFLPVNLLPPDRSGLGNPTDPAVIQEANSCLASVFPGTKLLLLLLPELVLLLLLPLPALILPLSLLVLLAFQSIGPLGRCFL